MKLLITLLCALIGAAIPLVSFYLLWHWCISQITPTLAYAGAIKVGITLVMVFVGAGATIGLAFIGTLIAGGLAAIILDL